ncbi:head-tail joining protein [Stutzerimonas nitrititolerans]|uniref:head-tail joining protein n=1 Tax=Stutzerimonas nitrititolerans TaxID=2482751 RepID=UPI0028A68B02|nr:hypothetical protein [Stutzerimonas nitrititolerans]
MRAGRLRYRGQVLSLDDQLQPVVLGSRWVDIRTKEGETPAPLGLRQRSLVEIRARFSEVFRSGRYLRHGDRLFHLVSPRDPRGNGVEVVVSAEELIGAPATYTAQPGAEPLLCRVFLDYEVARPGQFGGMVEYATQLEAALIEVGRPQPGAVFLVDGVRWRVAGLVEREDDRVVRRMWVKRI